MNDVTVLLVDDEPNLRRVLGAVLEADGYRIISADCGRDALKKAKAEQHLDLVITDYLMPDLNGLQVLDGIRKLHPTVKSLVVSGHGTVRSAVEAMRLGAFDYITKPFDTELLLYKIKAILQRSAVVEDEEQEQFKISNMFFDSVLRQLRVGDNEYKLSPKENELLKLLCLHRNDFMPRDLALRKIWKKENYFTARSMDVYIAKLRKLLKDDEGLEIINVHGEGFRLLVKN